jgi:hypothetical protein
MRRTLKLLVGLLLVGAAVSAVAVAASSPSVSSVSASSITTSSAVLKGKVNPNGESTTYQFQWGLTTQYGSAGPSQTLKAGTKAISVRTTASGLLPGTTYHFRLVAFNHSGATLGVDHTFHTAGNPPPAAATGPANNISANAATVTGIINPHGETTIWAVQYGLTNAYGVETFQHAIPAGNAPVTVSQPLTGLAAGTTFHYRIVALHNGSVAQAGADATFMTLPKPRPVPRVRASTSPHRDGSAPFTFTTSGSIGGPASTPASLRCTQSVRISFLLGKRKLASNLAPVQSTCKFSLQTTFKHLPGHGPKNRHVQLKVFVHFLGNNYLAPANAKPGHVTLG